LEHVSHSKDQEAHQRDERKRRRYEQQSRHAVSVHGRLAQERGDTRRIGESGPDQGPRLVPGRLLILTLDLVDSEQSASAVIDLDRTTVPRDRPV
jgi:hypothetical protein